MADVNEEEAAFMESPDFMYPGMDDPLPEGAMEGIPDDTWPEYMLGTFALVPKGSCPNKKNVVKFDEFLKAASIPWAQRKLASVFASNPSWYWRVGENNELLSIGINPKLSERALKLNVWFRAVQPNGMQNKTRVYFEKMTVDGEEVLSLSMETLRWDKAEKQALKVPFGDRKCVKTIQKRYAGKDAKGNPCILHTLQIAGSDDVCTRYMRKTKDVDGKVVAYND